MQYYKVARIDGFDFHTGKTINYREMVGKTVKNPKHSDSHELCSDNVLHASELFIDALNYGQIPCSVFVVEGTPVSTQSDKYGFKELKVVEEIPTHDFKKAYYQWNIWMLNDIKNNLKDDEFGAVSTIEQTIQVFSNALMTGKINESAAMSAESAAMSAVRSARSAESAKKRELSEKFIEFLRNSA